MKKDESQQNSDDRFPDANHKVDQFTHSNLRYGRSDIEDILKALGECADHHPFVWSSKCKL